MRTRRKENKNNSVTRGDKLILLTHVCIITLSHCHQVEWCCAHVSEVQQADAVLRKLLPVNMATGYKQFHSYGR